MIRQLSTALIILLSAAAGAAEPAPEANVQHDEFFFSHRYVSIVPQQPTNTGDKVEVVELFWYGCPHCNDFELYLDKWLEKKSDASEFRRLPAVFGKESWKIHARAYFTAEILGVVDKIHVPMFNAIHKARRKMTSESELVEMFDHAGIDKKKFLSVFNSFSVNNKVRNAAEMSRKYGITGVPSVIINGKYRTSNGTAGSYSNVIKVMDYLIEKEQAAATTAKINTPE